MISPQQLFQEFAEAYRRDGSADPREYLSQTDGIDREELGALIDGFLERAPRRRWDAAAFSGSMAERALTRATAPAENPVAGEAAAWSELLPALRMRARLKRKALVERLAAALGFPDQEERVADYYHRMEQGQLAPSGVSNRVLEALGEIVGSPADVLRRSGEAGQLAGEAGGEVFARVGAPADDSQVAGRPTVLGADIERSNPPDELDLLFTGGD